MGSAKSIAGWAVCVCLLLSTYVISLPSNATAQTSSNLIISEIMFDPKSEEDDWEWIEIYNAGSSTVNLAGYVLDDGNTRAHSAANISSGSIDAGQSAVLYNADDVSATEFKAAWGDVDLIGVSGWSRMSLNNSFDDIALWDSFSNYTGDHQTQLNAIERVEYFSFISGWPDPPSGGGPSIYLKNLGADNNSGSSWALSTVNGNTPVFTGYQALPLGGNSGLDIGSPGKRPEPEPTVTPTETATGTPTETAVPTETSTATTEPTATETIVPTETSTATTEPTATETLVPTPTETTIPTETSTATAEPTATQTLIPTPTETAVPTETSTATAEPTVTQTLIPTPTETAVPTETSTATAEPTATQTLIPTPTETTVPTETSTATAEPTATQTLIPTPTETAVPTETSTATAEPTATQTLVPTPTETTIPTETSIATAEPTATQTLVPTPTETSIATAEPTVTQTLIPTPTETAVPTETSTATAEPTATQTLVPAPTETAVPTETSIATAEPTATQTLVPTPTETAIPTETSIATAEPTATQTLVPAPTETTIPTETSTATAEPTATQTLVPTPTETAIPTETSTATAEPTATQTLVPTPETTLIPIPSPSATVDPITNSGQSIIFLPITQRNSQSSIPDQLPDLIIESISFIDQELTVTIKNIGPGSVKETFWIDLFINPTTDPTMPNDTLEWLFQSGYVWGIDEEALPISPDQQITLHVGEAHFSSFYSNYTGTLQSGDRLVAHIDSAHAETNFGAVLELHEQANKPYNNIFIEVLK